MGNIIDRDVLQWLGKGAQKGVDRIKSSLAPVTQLCNEFFPSPFRILPRISLYYHSVPKMNKNLDGYTQ
jgi:hypothetical protein